MPELRRVILTFKPDGIQVRTLYQRQGGPGPSTRARRREVAQLARTGLERALEALAAGDVVSVGESGFQVREDTLALSVGSSGESRRVKGEALSN
jgi:hypothetical protein